MSEERDQWLKSVGISYALLRLNICLHGFVRWTAGLRSFAESLLRMFQKTTLPDVRLHLRLCAADCQTLVGASVLFGFQTQRALISGSVLMLVLTFGSTLRQDWPTVRIQITYSLVCSLLLVGIGFDSYGIDQMLSH
jgi:thiosulfate dehydrogenase [quinone] large subunit